MKRSADFFCSDAAKRFEVGVDDPPKETGEQVKAAAEVVRTPPPTGVIGVWWLIGSLQSFFSGIQSCGTTTL